MDVGERIPSSKSGSGRHRDHRRRRRCRRLCSDTLKCSPTITTTFKAQSPAFFHLVFTAVIVLSLTASHFIPSAHSFSVPSALVTSFSASRNINFNTNSRLFMGNDIQGGDDDNNYAISKTIEKKINTIDNAARASATVSAKVVVVSTKGQVEQLQQHHNQRKQQQQRKQPRPLNQQQLQPTHNQNPPPNRHKNKSIISNSNNINNDTNHHPSFHQRNLSTHRELRPQQQQEQQQQRRRRCSTNQDKKRHVRYLYSKARSLEKMGSWNESSQILHSIITKYDPYDAHSYLALARLEGRRERTNSIHRQQQHPQKSLTNIDCFENEEAEGDDRMVAFDDHVIGDDTTTTTTTTSTTTSTFTTTTARQIFQRGTTNCPDSIHLWHAWAMHEMSRSNIQFARTLFDKALLLDPTNGYVCHAYGMLEMQEWHRNSDSSGGGGGGGDSAAHEEHPSKAKAEQLWKQGMEHHPSAALITSLGQLYISTGRPTQARQLYESSIPLLQNDRERAEVYIASASLEEHVFRNVESASNLLKAAVNNSSVDGGRMLDSRAYVALARLGSADVMGKSSGLGGGGGLAADDGVVKGRLKQICMTQWREMQQQQRRWRGAQTKRQEQHPHSGGGSGGDSSVAYQVEDGRLFNAWAKLESKANNLGEARRILRMGMKMYPKDHAILQAAGNIEERRGNVTAARDLYSASLHIELSAPALIAYAMLELRSPEDTIKGPNITTVRKLFNEALLIDPKHGPVYNAFGNLERRQGNVDVAKRLYEDGINANCTDAPSVYHGLAKLHLSLGEVEEARSVLQRGLALFGGGGSSSDIGNTNSNHASSWGRNANIAFLAHTLALIELNCNNNPTRAKRVLEQGLWHCGSSSQLLLAMALCESRLGNDTAARTMFEKSLMADQCHAQAWQSFGVLEMRAGNFKSAKTLFECGLKNSPNHGALWQAYGTLESWKGDVSQARLLFAAGIAKCPHHVPLYQAWACLELRAGDVLTAKRLISEALTRNKRNGSGWLVAAKIEEKMGNTGLVGLILRRGIECAPGNPELYRALAEHEISRRRIDNARELLETGIELNPLYAPLYHSLAELEARVFNIDGLAKLNKRLASIFPSDANALSSSSQQTSAQAWGNRIKLQHSSSSTSSGRILPDGITALAQKIGVDSDSPTIVGGSGSSLVDDLDPETLLNTICGFDGTTGDEDAMMLFQDVPYAMQEVVEDAATDA